jgi:SET domain-containing protein
MNVPVQVGFSQRLGCRGLFAARDISKWESIERCPVILIPEEQSELIDSCVLGNYYFRWLDQYAWPVGHSVLMNHACPANVGYERDMSLGEIEFIAAEQIAAGTELCINYGGGMDTRLDTKVVFAANGDWSYRGLI